MNEMATESAPSTADVAEQVIESFETSETPTETVAETSPEPTSEAQPSTPSNLDAQQTPTPAVVQSEAAKFLEGQGHKATKADGRPNWLPIKTVERMLDRYSEQRIAAATSAHETVSREHQTLRSQFDEIRPVLDALDQGPEAFLATAAQHDPRYKAFLESRQAPQAPQPQAAPVGEMPAPDIQLPGGGSTYSLDGLQKLLEWNTAQVEARLLPKVDEKFKPWQEREQQAQQRAEQERAQAAVQQRTRSQMEEAQTWPMFGKLADDGSLTPFQQEVLEVLRKDSEAAKAAGRRPTMTLHQAYMQAFTPRFVEDDAKRRERLAAEISAANGTRPTVARSGAEAPKAPGPLTTAEIAARTLDRLEGRG